MNANFLNSSLWGYKMDEVTKTSAIAKFPKGFKKTKKLKVFKGTELPGSRYTNMTHLIPKDYMSRYGKKRRKDHRRKDRKRRFKRITDLA